MDIDLAADCDEGGNCSKRLREIEKELQAVSQFAGPAWDSLRNELESERTKLRHQAISSKP
eukprot:8975764-Pyramimonas_sp.AAC.1